MAQVDFVARRRHQTGKGAARKLRRQGRVPAVLYGQGLEENLLLDLDIRDVEDLLHRYGYNAILRLTMEDGSPGDRHLAMVADYQRDYLNRHLLHVDLVKIALDRAVHTTVPIRLVGECKGLKQGGVLEHHLRQVRVKALPTALPEYLEIDVTEVGLGGHVTVGDIVPVEGLEILDHDPQDTVATVHAPRVVEGAAPEGEGVPVASGEAAAEG